MSDVTKYPDFRRLYSTNSKRNIWLLGYFGGGDINILDVHSAAIQFSSQNNVPLETIKIGEIQVSQWCKYFKFLYSSQDDQSPHEESQIIEDFYKFIQ
jgi:hypothetical protein